VDIVPNVARVSPSRGTWVVYAIFLASGVGLVMPGAMLPLLLNRWHIGDAQAGILFFLFFLGSTAGAILSRGSLKASIVRGCLATAAGVMLLAASSRMVAFATIAIYGFGLGVVMTSVSLLQSRRHEHSRTAQMARLNLTWAVGACIGPSLALRGAGVLGVPGLFAAMALFFALAAVVVLLAVPDAPRLPKNFPALHGQAPVLPLLLMVALATGVESATGGWLATYSKRAGQTLGEVIGAATCFWVGMLVSRSVQSHRRVADAAAGPLFFAVPWLIAAALGLVLTSSGGPSMIGGALLLGLAVGPLYPQLLASALSRGEAGNIVFVLAGCGSALLPLVTGLVSQWAGSLRAGLCVPLLGSLAMGCLGLAVWRGNTLFVQESAGAAKAIR
jgi:MFS transporter, FHS family, glucose/mannose:H+ symporter